MQHKWHKEIKAWADGAEIEMWYPQYEGWGDCINPMFDTKHQYRIKPQPKEEPYWLCCGCKDPRHNKSCLEAKMGHPERCKFGTVSEHFKPQPKEPQYLYVYDHGGSGFSWQSGKIPGWNNIYIGKIKLEDE